MATYPCAGFRHLPELHGAPERIDMDRDLVADGNTQERGAGDFEVRTGGRQEPVRSRWASSTSWTRREIERALVWREVVARPGPVAFGEQGSAPVRVAKSEMRPGASRLRERALQPSASFDLLLTQAGEVHLGGKYTGHSWPSGSTQDISCRLVATRCDFAGSRFTVVRF